MKHPIPKNEKARLENLASYGILDSEPEAGYDDITKLVTYISNMPISTLAFIDENRKWHKSKIGLKKEFVPRSFSICSHTIMNDKTLIINDTKEHECIKNVGMVANPPHIRFYAGVPLISSEGFAIGTLCALDTKPNSLNDKQIDGLEILGRSVVCLLEARRNVKLLELNQKEITHLNHELKHLSRTDELTGLWNRRVLHEALDRELKVNKRTKGSLAVMLLDIDNFKTINDQLGHKLGDEAIVLVANVLKKEIRETDYCIRYGGDEFIIIILGDNHRLSDALSDRIRANIENASKSIKTFTISIGVVVVESEEIDSEQVLQLADKCMYQAKENGRNKAVIKTI